MEKKVLVEACPDLSDMRRVGGVRLTVGIKTVDLTVAEAQQLAEDIATELSRVRVVMV